MLTFIKLKVMQLALVKTQRSVCKSWKLLFLCRYDRY